MTLHGGYPLHRDWRVPAGCRWTADSKRGQPSPILAHPTTLFLALPAQDGSCNTSTDIWRVGRQLRVTGMVCFCGQALYKCCSIATTSRHISCTSRPDHDVTFPVARYCTCPPRARYRAFRSLITVSVLAMPQSPSACLCQRIRLGALSHRASPKPPP